MALPQSIEALLVASSAVPTINVLKLTVNAYRVKRLSRLREREIRLSYAEQAARLAALISKTPNETVTTHLSPILVHALVTQERGIALEPSDPPEPEEEPSPERPVRHEAAEEGFRIEPEKTGDEGED